jgi:hypothetical protein
VGEFQGKNYRMFYVDSLDEIELQDRDLVFEGVYPKAVHYNYEKTEGVEITEMVLEAKPSV